MALYPEGIVRGRFASEWGAYSHFVCDPAAGVIRLYSVRAPEIARVAWRPPDGAFRDAAELLARHLPAVPPPRPPWPRRRGAFLAAGALLSLAALLAGFALLRAGVPWVPWAFAGTAYAVCLGGIGLVRGFALD